MASKDSSSFRATEEPFEEWERRERSRSFSDGQTPPKPKPRTRVPRRAQSVRYSEGISLSADSSPRQPRDANRRSVLQPTPLVVALSKKLMNQLASQADVQSENATDGEEKTENGPTSVPVKPDRGSERMQPADDVKQPYKQRTPVIRRQRALSEPRSKNGPARPPPPAHPPPPNPRLSQLINNNRIHVIDSRTKSTPSRRRAATTTTTKYGTPPPSRPAPPPPKEKTSKPSNNTPSSPKPQQPPVPKPRRFPPPKPQTSQDVSPSLENNRESEANDLVEKDKSRHIYEDINRTENNYEQLDHSSDSEDDREADIVEKSSCGETDTPPPLPAKKGSKVVIKEQEDLPPLPPRSLPVKKVRKHGLLTDQGQREGEEKKTCETKDEAVEDIATDLYEPINYHGSEDESQDFYTEMNDPAHLSSDEDLVECDKPEDIYITMDPQEFIPPPNNYKHKKKANTYDVVD